MAQKSGFFNALLNAGVYDRTYNADDYSDNLAVVISNGVLRMGDNDLKVTASGLNLTVNSGRAWINGKYYYNDTSYALPVLTAPVGGSRIDRVVLRLDKTTTVRSITLQYLEGTAATSPVAPDLTRTDTIYDLCLAEITIAAGATTVTVTDTRSDSDLCGWVYSVVGDESFFENFDEEFDTWFENVKNTLSSVTLFKQYRWETTLTAATNTVQFSISQYDDDTCFVDVYVNGLLEDDYTISGDIITFTNATLAVGTEVTVLAYKSIDGTGIMTVSDEITELQNQYATLAGVSKFVYYCTGLNDNISLSEIAQAIYDGSYTSGDITTAAENFLTALGGNTWLAGLASDAKITIDVVGTVGVGNPAYGTGTSTSRYRYFNFGQTVHSDKQIIWNFAKADKITVAPTSGECIIFYGTDLELRNCSCKATNGSVVATIPIQMIANSNAGRINCIDCSFEIDTNGDAKIAEQGTFINCYCNAASSDGHALLFVPSSNEMVRLIGGTYLAYTAGSSKTSAVIYVYGGQTYALVMANNINCPTVTKSGYTQYYLVVGYAGKTIIDLVASTLSSTGNYYTITNQVQYSKEW